MRIVKCLHFYFLSTLKTSIGAYNMYVFMSFECKFVAKFHSSREVFRYFLPSFDEVLDYPPPPIPKNNMYFLCKVYWKVQNIVLKYKCNLIQFWKIKHRDKNLSTGMKVTVRYKMFPSCFWLNKRAYRKRNTQAIST